MGRCLKEALDFIGSTRFLWDLEAGRFPYPSSPTGEIPVWKPLTRR